MLRIVNPRPLQSSPIRELTRHGFVKGGTRGARVSGSVAALSLGRCKEIGGAESGLPRRLLSKGILDGDAAISKGKHVASGRLYLAPILARRREDPLSDATVTGDKMLRVSPMSIWHRLEQA